MALEPSCLHCRSRLAMSGGRWGCPAHGDAQVVWRAREASYDALTLHLELAASLPTLLPWPLPPGWGVTDVAVVLDGSERPRATLTSASGTSEADGPVDLLVVVEEPGAGLGARVAGLAASDPGPEFGLVPPAARVGLGVGQVPLWSLSTARVEPEFDRSVLVGEVSGRWLWLVLRPAPALLLMRGRWILRDAAELGPVLVEVPFSGPPPRW